VDVHTGAGWIVRHNVFRNIRAPRGQLAGPAILMWNGSANTLVDGNTFVDCQREISLGLVERVPNDHSGGIVRNNFVYRRPGLRGDAAILVADSPNTQVVHNSILMSGTYGNAIEYRFARTSGVLIANNASDGAIRARDGAAGTVTGNYTGALPGMFLDAAAGDLHLRASAAALRDQIVTPIPSAGADWDGQNRPAGAIDIGADEYVPGGPPPPPRNLRFTDPGT
jgi:hypothetical protein